MYTVGQDVGVFVQEGGRVFAGLERGTGFEYHRHGVSRRTSTAIGLSTFHDHRVHSVMAAGFYHLVRHTDRHIIRIVSRIARGHAGPRSGIEIRIDRTRR